MTMTIIVATNVKSRVSGFLGSVMLEVAPTVYLSAQMSRSVRQRVWETLTEWHSHEPQGSVVLIWRTAVVPTGIEVLYLGIPRRDLVELDGLLVVRRALNYL